MPAKPSLPRHPSRRAFLGAAAATGAGALAWSWRSDGPDLQWCGRPSFPLAAKRVWILSRDLDDGTEVRARLQVRGPGSDWLDLREEPVRITGDAVAWDIRLSHGHPELVPGRYDYRVVVSSDAGLRESAPVGYTLRPFAFGA